MSAEAELHHRVSVGGIASLAGAGVSIAASAGEPAASWLGLLEEGVSRVEQHGTHLPNNWGAVMRQVLELGTTDGLLSVADQITSALGGQEGGQFRTWMRETVGSMPMIDVRLPAAIAALGGPVLTTNYDGLLIQSSNRFLAPGGSPGFVTWRDSGRVQRVLRADDADDAVVHLHGFWDEPQSVILGVRSYDLILNAGAIQALERSISTTRSILMIGVGVGADDPNLGALLRWVGTTFPHTEYPHYRLCTTDELGKLQERHSGESIVPISYGDSHRDLPSFLERLALPIDKVGVDRSRRQVIPNARLDAESSAPIGGVHPPTPPDLTRLRATWQHLLNSTGRIRIGHLVERTKTGSRLIGQPLITAPRLGLIMGDGPATPKRTEFASIALGLESVYRLHRSELDPAAHDYFDREFDHMLAELDLTPIGWGNPSSGALSPMAENAVYRTSESTLERLGFFDPHSGPMAISVTGPIASGKTTEIYRIIQRFAAQSTNVYYVDLAAIASFARSMDSLLTDLASTLGVAIGSESSAPGWGQLDPLVGTLLSRSAAPTALLLDGANVLFGSAFFESPDQARSGASPDCGGPPGDGTEAPGGRTR